MNKNTNEDVIKSYGIIVKFLLSTLTKIARQRKDDDIILTIIEEAQEKNKCYAR